MKWAKQSNNADLSICLSTASPLLAISGVSELFNMAIRSAAGVDSVIVFSL